MLCNSGGAVASAKGHSRTQTLNSNSSLTTHKDAPAVQRLLEAHPAHLQQAEVCAELLLSLRFSFTDAKHMHKHWIAMKMFVPILVTSTADLLETGRWTAVVKSITVLGLAERDETAVLGSVSGSPDSVHVGRGTREPGDPGSPI